MKKIPLMIALHILILCTKGYGQNVQTDISACKNVELIFKQLKANFPKYKIEATIDSVLQTKPYRIMFQHYNIAACQFLFCQYNKSMEQ